MEISIKEAEMHRVNISFANITMKTILCVVLALAVASAEVKSVDELSAFNYHKKIGIPLAAQIKRSEEDALNAQQNQRIIGGAVTNVSDIPYQAGLSIQVTALLTSVCGGSLISNTRVLTAAHCYWDGVMTARSFTVVLGTNTIFSGGTRLTTATIVMHPNWNPWNNANDIAVIRISSVSFSNLIQPIALPTGTEVNQNFVGDTARASGWGVATVGGSIASGQTLRAVNLQIVANTQCSATFGSDYFHASNICTRGATNTTNICTGDTGGPLAILSFGRRVLVGVASYIAPSGCNSGEPAAHARVTSYLQWIASI